MAEVDHWLQRSGGKIFPHVQASSLKSAEQIHASFGLAMTYIIIHASAAGAVQSGLNGLRARQSPYSPILKTHRRLRPPWQNSTQVSSVCIAWGEHLLCNAQELQRVARIVMDAFAEPRMTLSKPRMLMGLFSLTLQTWRLRGARAASSTLTHPRLSAARSCPLHFRRSFVGSTMSVASPCTP